MLFDERHKQTAYVEVKGHQIDVYYDRWNYNAIVPVNGYGKVESAQWINGQLQVRYSRGAVLNYYGTFDYKVIKPHFS